MSRLPIFLFLVASAGCQGVAELAMAVPRHCPVQGPKQSLAVDVARQLERFPGAEVDVGDDGLPTFVRGALAHARFGQGIAATDALGPGLAEVAPLFRLRAEELELVDTRTDEAGAVHARYRQKKHRLPVVGGELSLHVRETGQVYAVTASARDGWTVAPQPSVDSATAATHAQGLFAGASVELSRLTYLLPGGGEAPRLAWEYRVWGFDDGLPVDDQVYVDAHQPRVLARYPRIHSTLSRKVYTYSGGLPGTLALSEGGAPVSNASVMAAYDNTGKSYDCNKALFNRDSYDDKGAALISTVEYPMVNAFWNGKQMAYGKASSNFDDFAKSLDVTTHELFHGVTQHSADLVYSKEPGALNEAMSDIASAACDAYVRGRVADETWLVGDDIYTPNKPGDALRYMANPTQDGQSRDYYPTRYTGSQDNGGVHLNSGIVNLAFKLLVTGGSHPRKVTTNQVPAIGMEKAAKIFYRALTTYLTSTSSMASARTGCEQAARDLYGASEVAAVAEAFAAVGVGTGTSTPGDGGVPPGDAGSSVDAGSTVPDAGHSTPDAGTNGTIVPLTSGKAVTGLNASRGDALRFSLEVPATARGLSFQLFGGTGNADLLVRFAAPPTAFDADYRSTSKGNHEWVAPPSSSQGTWYVEVRGADNFANTGLVGSFELPATTPPPGQEGGCP